jgi:D-alanyl-D-alanine carboxypeptidase/D-alanyl-D-alanine-endopeptidase (penicillin-binding protein 4)
VTRGKLTGFVAFALACAVGAAFLLGGLRPSEARAAIGSSPPVRTPLWSARRLPSIVHQTVESAAQARAGAALTQQLAPILAPYDACVAVEGPGGSLARVNADRPLTPASTLKLLTATAAISRLGPNRHFTTRVLTDGDNLVVVGAGDPLLATPEYIAFRHGEPRYRNAPYTPLANLADAVAATGVHEVRGAVVVDDHVHDSLRYLPDWKPNYGVDGEIGALGALAVDGGFSEPDARVPAIDPAVTTGQRLVDLLRARGVTVAGGVVRGQPSNGAHEIAHVDSPALSDIVAEMLTSSDDFTAEELVRDLVSDTPATTSAGTQVVVEEMQKLGIATSGLVMRDGSGLAPSDRATCSTLLKLVDVIRQPKFAAVDKGLAIAGLTGTLAGRFVGTPLAGKLRAKTGSLDNVVGLAGVIDGRNELRFAFVANGGFTTAAGAQLQAEVASVIGTTPEVRPPADLVPAP